jgi:hypothetical protein
LLKDAAAISRVAMEDADFQVHRALAKSPKART